MKATAETTETKVWTEDEEFEALCKVLELEEAGKFEEAEELEMSIPLEPYVAFAAKEAFGAKFLIESGFNLSWAEARYGKDWLNK